MPRLPVKSPGPKGLAPYSPEEDSNAGNIYRAAVAVVDERYDGTDASKLGSREIGYILTRQGFHKSDIKTAEQAIERARRAQRIPFEAISDGRTSWDGAWQVADEKEIVKDVRARIREAQLDRQEGQPVRVEVWAEAAAWLARLVPTCAEYGVEVRSGSGSVPVDAVRQTAFRVINAIAAGEQPTVILWIGDLDLNGLKNIATPFEMDVRAFVRDILKREPNYLDKDVATAAAERWLIVRRLMVTAEQVEGGLLVPASALGEVDDDLLDAGWPWSYTVQAEALLPEDRDRIVTEALDGLLDPVLRGKVVRREKRLHTAARAALRA